MNPEYCYPNNSDPTQGLSISEKEEKLRQGIDIAVKKLKQASEKIEECFTSMKKVPYTLLEEYNFAWSMFVLARDTYANFSISVR